MTSASQINVVLFGGQGTLAANLPEIRQRAVDDATTSSGSTLLSACHKAFHSELSSLNPATATSVDLDALDFPTPQSLITLPTHHRYLSNPVVSGTTLFLLHTLRYLAFIEASASAQRSSSSSFTDLLETNATYGVGILGFSSGILPAAVVATSSDTLQYINNAVQAFRVAFWIGVHTQLYKTSEGFYGSAIDGDSPPPWSIVFLGLGKQAAVEAIFRFSLSQPSDAPKLFVTSETAEDCVTISGRPDVLSAFAQSGLHSGTVQKTLVDTLYHSPAHIGGARERVLSDLAGRGVQFPSFSDIKIPLRSTYTGELIRNDGAGASSLLEAVVDMILTQPINWTKVAAATLAALPENEPVRILGIGPGTGIMRSLERTFGKRVTSSLDVSAVKSAAPEKTHPTQEPIAIVGMAVNMPGAPDVSMLWEVLEKGLNTISEIPEDRFKVSDYAPDSSKNSKRSMAAHTGNFIDEPDAFDNRFFNISPREARSMDPQQRVLLHTAYEALEDSGYVPNSSPTNSPDTFGCYIGVSTEDYVHNLENDIDVYYSTGTLRAFLSGRISYALKLSGPSIVIDTACSSSLVAIYQACRALMNHDCNGALAGGVNIITSPDMFLGLDRGHFLSPTGQCQSFDSSADGYSRSEGAGVFVLKRLADAVAEGDHIYGVIRGVEVNQSGLARSITHPHSATQVSLFKQLLTRTGIDPNRVSVIEAHGTGTQAGDPNELQSIRSVFAVNRSSNNPLHVTSLKANIGHLEAASGAAGLAKLLLMLQHRTIPRQISLRNLNPKIEPLASDNTVIDTVATPWTVAEAGSDRMALLNNFGAAGSNAALLLSEFVPPTVASSARLELPFVFGLSAKTEDALNSLKSRYLEWLSNPSTKELSFADIAYTSTARRQLFPRRLAVSASSHAELEQKLRSASSQEVVGSSGKVAFVFSGQGGQYIGMGAALYETSSIFRSAIDECHSFLTATGFPGVLQIIISQGQLTTVEEFEAYQAAVFSLEYALAQLWISWGVVPDVVVGHSLGEYAAQVIAGVLSLKGALTIVATRARLMVQNCALESTGMIAINMGPEKVDSLLRSSPSFSSATISCFNSAADCVVSGPIEQLKALKAHIDSDVKCKNVLLSVPFGYHSSAMQPILDDLTLAASRVTIRPPTIPVISNVIGQVVSVGDSSVFTPEYYARHCAEPVLFEKGISDLLATAGFANIAAWIEVGPHPTTLPMLKSHPALSAAPLLLPSIRKKQDVWTTLSSSLANLYTTTVQVEWRQVFSHVPTTCISLPSYPFTKGKFWVQYEDKTSSAVTLPRATAATPTAHLVNGFSMLYSWAQFPSENNGRVAVFETPISQLAGYIVGHKVGGHALCPASVYHELALAGVESAKEHLQARFADSYIALRAVDYAKPLVYVEGEERVVKTTITLEKDGKGVFSVSSEVNGTSVTTHCSGKFKFTPVTDTTIKFQRSSPSLQRQISAITSGKDEQSQTFTARTAYEVIFPRVVTYSKEYHSMKTLTVSSDGMDGYSLTTVPKDNRPRNFVIHPVFMDTMLHVAGFVANLQGESNDAYICTKVESVKAVPGLINPDAVYGVFISNAWVESEGVMMADATAIEVEEPKRIVAQLKGMHFRKVRLDRLKRGLGMSGSHAASKSTSNPSAAPARVETVAPAPTRPSTRPSTPPPSVAIDILGDVTRIVGETCQVSNLDPNADLASYGVDSLMSIEIFHKLKSTFATATLDRDILSSCQSVSQIVAAVRDSLPTPTVTPQITKPKPASLPSQPQPAPERKPAADALALVTLIVAETCGIDPATMNAGAHLETFGVDSLMSIEIFHKLKGAFPGVPLDATTLADCNTIEAIVDEVNAASGIPLSPPAASVVVSEAHDASVSDSGIGSSTSEHEAGVKSVVAQVLGVPYEDIADEHDLELLGMDSLRALEVRSQLEKKYSITLPMDRFSTCRTVTAIESLVSSYTNKKPDSDQVSRKVALDPKLQALAETMGLTNAATPIQHGTIPDRASLFVIHDGGGRIDYTKRLLPLDRDVWGINNPYFFQPDTWESLEEMAAEYVGYILRAAPSKPVVLAGWCVGGVIAFDVARRLMREGVTVTGVILLDSPPPNNHVPITEDQFNWVTKRRGAPITGDMIGFVRKQFVASARMLSRYCEGFDPNGPVPRLVYLRAAEGLQIPGAHPFITDRSDPEKIVEGWRSLVGDRLKICEMPGDHFQTFDNENIETVSRLMAEGCAYLESL